MCLTLTVAARRTGSSAGVRTPKLRASSDIGSARSCQIALSQRCDERGQRRVANTQAT